MKRTYLGVDVGATKTQALVADETGQAVGWGQGGPGNHEVAGYEGLSQSVCAAVEQALSAAGVRAEQVAGAGFGVAGYDWPSEREPTLQALRPLGLSAPVEIVNDTLIGLLAGSSEGWGVAVVAGTGCNCWGWDRARRTGRVTGYGTWMGEGAGGGELVWQAVCQVAKAWTRRGPATALTEALAGHCGARDGADLLEGLGVGRYHLGAGAAPLVFRAAAAGDEVARQAIRWAGRELGDLAAGVIRQLGFEAEALEVVLVGGLFDGGVMLIEPMRETIHEVAPQARLVRLGAPPAIGGVLLGMEQAGVRDPAIRSRLIESTAAMGNSQDHSAQRAAGRIARTL
jgi:N-acetylglucosamine kinase-like BadF-type ATPase